MKTLFTALALFLAFSSSASHLISGQLYYNHLQGDSYRITLVLYRDCYCSNCASFGNPEYVSIFSNGNLVSQVAMPFTTSTPDTLTPVDSCVIPSVCAERAIYNATIALPPVAIGYHLVYQRCCWSAASTTFGSTQEGMTLDSYIPSNNGSTFNNSAHFPNEIPGIFGANDSLEVDMSAIDPDPTDSIRYSLCDIYGGADAICPDPSPNSSGGGCSSAPPPPPYTPVYYNGSLGPTNFINNPNNSGALKINYETGMLTGIPNQVGIFQIAICAQEYRNNVFISENRSYWRMVITQCHVAITALESITEEEVVSVYPNPASSIINIKSGLIPEQIIITDLRGRTTHSIAPDSNVSELNVSNLERGMYFVILRFKGKTLQRKISLQ